MRLSCYHPLGEFDPLSPPGRGLEAVSQLPCVKLAPGQEFCFNRPPTRRSYGAARTHGRTMDQDRTVSSGAAQIAQRRTDAQAQPQLLRRAIVDPAYRRALEGHARLL